MILLVACCDTVSCIEGVCCEVDLSQGKRYETIQVALAAISCVRRTHTYIHTYTYIHIHTHIHTHIRTYTHTYTNQSIERINKIALVESTILM